MAYDPSEHPWRCGCGHELKGEPMTPPFHCIVEGCKCAQCKGEPEDGNPDIDHDSTDDIVCPQCGDVMGDSWERRDDNGKEKCDECGCEFYWEREVSVSYSTRVVTTKDREREAKQEAERQQRIREHQEERELKKHCNRKEDCPSEHHWSYCPRASVTPA